MPVIKWASPYVTTYKQSLGHSNHSYAVFYTGPVLLPEDHDRDDNANDNDDKAASADDNDDKAASADDNDDDDASADDDDDDGASADDDDDDCASADDNDDDGASAVRRTVRPPESSEHGKALC